MLELTINGEVYSFHFGMGFMREINKKAGMPVDGIKDVTKNIGLQYTVGCVLDGDVEALVDILDAANKSQSKRVTRALLDSYIDSEDTDIDALFDEVIDFLRRANATKKAVAQMIDAYQEAKKNQGQAAQA